MPQQLTCGIYAITLAAAAKLYVGSSRNMAHRWKEHRRALTRGNHHSLKLQRAWNKYGADAFTFTIIEECPEHDLFVREQHYLDTLKPHFNVLTTAGPGIGPEQRERINATLRARADLITHCPRGHAYDEKNTHVNKRGKRICRECARLRTAEKLAKETPEQRRQRKHKAMSRYMRTSRAAGRSDRWSVEHRSRISAGLKGRQVSEKTRLILAEHSKKRCTPEFLQKMWDAAKRRIELVGGSRLGSSPSQETRAKISATLKAKITHCVHGHEFNEENTLIEKKTGKRICRACRRRIKMAAKQRANTIQVL